MLKFIHIADVHLCRSFDSCSFSKTKAAAQRERLWQSFREVIDVIKRERIELLFIAGDLFEERYARVCDIKRLADYFAGIADTTDVYIAPGNHDPFFSGSYYDTFSWPSNVHIFTDSLKKVALSPTVDLYGFGFARPHYDHIPFSLPAVDQEKLNLCLLHCDLLSASQYLPIEEKTMKNAGFDFCFLGHIHQNRSYQWGAAYASSLEPLDFSQSGLHGYYKGRITKKGITLSFVNSAKSHFYTKEIPVCADMDSNAIKQAVLDAFPPAMRAEGAFCRAVIKGSRDARIDLHDVFMDICDAFSYLETVDQTVEDLDIETLRSQNQENIIGQFIAALDQRDDDIARLALKEGLEVLLESRNAQ